MQKEIVQISGFKIIKHDLLDSTNEEAKRSIFLKQNFNFDKVCIIAEMQQKGKGRYDRKWQSEPGNLFLSIILQKKIPIEHLSPIISLAIYNVLKNLKLNYINIKWPNDILIDGSNISGILIESYKNQLGEYYIIGVGVNIKKAPQITDNIVKKTTSLKDQKIVTSIDDFLILLLKEISNLITSYPKNLSDLNKSYKEKLDYLGQKITIKTKDSSIEGVFEDIDENFNLILKTDSETRKINFGEIF